VAFFIRRCQDFAFINVVDAQSFQKLRLHEVADSCLGHDRNGNGLFDFGNHGRIGHAGHPAVLANVRRHALQRHHGDRARLFRDFGLLHIGDVHDDAALEHLRQLNI